MKLSTLFLAAACMLSSAAFGQETSSKAATNGGHMLWEKTPEQGEDVQASGFMDPSNPDIDPWEVSVVRVRGLRAGENPGERNEREQRTFDAAGKSHMTPSTGPESDNHSASSAIQPFTDVEVQCTYSSGISGVPDGCAAVSGSGWIVSSNNTHVEWHDENGTVFYSQGEDTFWAANSPTGNIYDPKILYNASANKFVLIAMHGSSPSLTELYVAYSVSSNPNDGWWVYEFDGNPGTLSSLWFDYPSMGHSAVDLFVSGNMFTAADSYSTTSLFQLEMTDGFTGGAISWVYWDDMNETDGDNAFTVKPLQYPFGTYGPGIYCAGVGNDNASINYFDVTANLGDSPTLQSFEVSATAWTNATNASQSGTTDMLDTGGDRLRTGYYGGDGNLHLAHSVNRNGSGFSELRYTQVDISAGTSTSSDFGLDNWDYGFPWMVPWALNSATWDGGSMFGFLRVSSTSFPEFRCVHMDGGLTFGGSVGIRSGDSNISASNGTNRWGDYIGGGWREGASVPEVWLYGQFGQNNDHAMWLAEVVGEIEGCTDPAACNYNPDATSNVGCEYVTCSGCTVDTACNYDAGATVDDGSCTYPGCTDFFACNYSASAGCNDGSCCYNTCVVMDMAANGLFGGDAINYTVIDNADGSTAWSGVNDILGGSDLWCAPAGCYTITVTVEAAPSTWTLRFDPTFYIIGFDYTIFSGTGTFTGEFIVGDGGETGGCTDGTACNYDAAAICDNGTCCYENCLSIDMTDSFGDGWNGNTWEVIDPADGSVVATGTLEDGSTGIDVACLEAGCYDFQINTDDGQFQTEVGWTLLGTDETVDPTGGSTDVVTFTIAGGGTDYDCTDPLACNYSAIAICDDGSCCYLNCAVFDLTDSFGDGWNGGVLEISHEGTLIETVEMTAGSTGQVELCLADGCYRFTFVAGNFPEEAGWVMTLTANGHIVGGGGFFDEDVSINGVSGCMNEAACNYDAAATCDDGSCEYGLWYIPDTIGAGPVVQSCDGAPVDYTLANQSCVESVIAADPFCVNNLWDGLCATAYNCCLGVYGCVDPTACSYDNSSPCSDPSLCVYGGCTDPTACNFSAAAGCDDGTCDFSCVGCTYPDATNYDAALTMDDGSCIFEPCTGGDCPGDLTDDGEIGTPDLLAILGMFGTTCE